MYSIVGNYLRPSNNYKQLIFNINAVVLILIMWLFLTVPWVVLQCVIVVLPDHTHLHFGANVYWSKNGYYTY